MAYHPFFVHFPIAFWLLGSVLLWLSQLARFKRWHDTAWLLFCMGAITGLAAAIAGQEDYEALAGVQLDVLEQHRDLGNLLPWLMGITVLLYFHSRMAKKGPKVPKSVFLFLSLIISGVLIYVGFLGGATVYEHRVFPDKKKVEKKTKISVAPPENF